MRKILLLALILAALLACSKDEKTTPASSENIKIRRITLNQTEKIMTIGSKFQLTSTILPDNATNKAVTWSSSNRAAATVDQTGLVTARNDAAGKTTIITVTAKDGSYAEDACTITVISSDVGVLINGVIWARHNMSTPGNFVLKPDNFGMFYQWNSKTAWASAGSLPVSSPAGATWSSAIRPGSSWEWDNDPCPEGWYVPTLDKFKTLCEKDKVTAEWTTLNSKNGFKFTDNSNGNSIFLPAAGYRTYQSGTLRDSGDLGYYWSATKSAIYFSYNMYFRLDPDIGPIVNPEFTEYNSSGFSIRCIAK